MACVWWLFGVSDGCAVCCVRWLECLCGVSSGGDFCGVVFMFVVCGVRSVWCV